MSVPLTPELEKFIDQMVSEHEAETKAGVVRRALYKMSEEKAINDVLLASEEVRRDKVVRGDVDEILGKMMHKNKR
ncbi:MAG: hypothetical protein IID45_11955 [Planctomycetes bacterium]|nr:hypothetical protein [Planctomycetota bacterium]